MGRLLTYLLSALTVVAEAQEPRSNAVWDDFKAQLLAATITRDQLRPLQPQLLEPMMRFLDHCRRNSKPEDWATKPEIYVVGNQLHAIVTLTQVDGKRVPYCFSLVREGQHWYFQHVESIFIRLDKTGPLPASQFPDVTEAQKNWMRDERRATEQVKMFNFLTREKGIDFALRLFKDGEGYALEARTWVPFVSPYRAFVLFLCWEQAKLFGNPVTLESLEENAAIVRWQPRWFKLYKQTGHLAQIISEDRFRQIFDTTWHDRARAAGWKLAIEPGGPGEVIFRLNR